MAKKDWMKDAFKNAHGQLHKQLGVPEGTKIPLDKLEKASHAAMPKERKRAQLVLNTRKK